MKVEDALEMTGFKHGTLVMQAARRILLEEKPAGYEEAVAHLENEIWLWEAQKVEVEDDLGCCVMEDPFSSLRENESIDEYEVDSIREDREIVRAMVVSLRSYPRELREFSHGKLNSSDSDLELCFKNSEEAILTLRACKSIRKTQEAKYSKEARKNCKKVMSALRL